MDPVAIVFYALVCATLSLAAPHLRNRALRLAAGAATGVLAALILPWLRAALGI